MINKIDKTTIRVANSYGRMDETAVIYYLGLNKNFLISSLNSVTSTAITAMERFMSSIMDSLENIHPHTQLNSQKKSSNLFLSSSFYSP
ncbi:Uncharacterised protein [Campylobacter hyointestinalis subsp. hyointestinalis]|uniref:Uncharacterized protein n=1 Tax=Campylobacter hyointestinalis subsp. hyointestinalis TaxID=91352 RepID=A0A0S4SUX6_CAMHY|nr:Uncharacterised protein [Campylobacter hyointestinalis subsp. hyointestinalis]